MRYYIYENWTHDRAVIHKAECFTCQDGKGLHGVKRPKHGKWRGPFETIEEVEGEASKLGRKNVFRCSLCRGKNKTRFLMSKHKFVKTSHNNLSIKDELEIKTKRELYKYYLSLTRDLYHFSEPNKESPRLSGKRRRYLIGAFVFLAFTMESFINDFGGRYFEDFDDFERLSTPKKFLFFPKYAKEKSSMLLKKDSPPLGALKRLFNMRDTFAHYKPRLRTPAEKEEKLYGQVNHKNFLRTYKHMVKISKIFNAHFEMFVGNNDWISNYPEEP